MRLTGIKAVASAAALLVVVSVGAVYADFTAYNDCAWQGGQIQDTTKITYFSLGQTGTLKNYANNGASTGVTVTSSGNVTTDVALGTDCNAGTDAYNTFNGKVSIVGCYYADGAPSPRQTMTIAFSGLNPGKQYEFVTTVNRAGNYPTRTTTFALVGVDSCLNASSAGTNMNGTSTTLVSGENTANGHVARWTNIMAGADGAFSVTAGQGVGNDLKGYMFSAFMLRETSVPEPGSLVALGSGLLSMTGLAVRRRIRK